MSVSETKTNHVYQSLSSHPLPRASQSTSVSAAKANSLWLDGKQELLKNLSQSDAEERLAAQPKGTFLYRTTRLESANPDLVTRIISYVHSPAVVKHVPLLLTKTGGGFKLGKQMGSSIALDPKLSECYAYSAISRVSCDSDQNFIDRKLPEMIVSFMLSSKRAGT